ncbi:hypothetical protein VNO78_12217 [Psophocarpus tetragonolobus]|uniref:Amino acid transporter transmembrane domain-containing protein n=1 Tax=Psophocarpus tetragonolobus TaxID=3891 RepID=A0AAN9SNP9_PSOTE
MKNNPLIKSYPDIGEVAFGHKGRVLVTTIICIGLFLIAVELLILEGDNLEKLFPNMNFKIGDLRIMGKNGFVVLAALVILPTTWLRSLGALAYVSLGGVVVSIVLIGCVVWVGEVDGVGFHERGQLLTWEGLPSAVSLLAFCFSAHSLMPTLINSMNDRSQFTQYAVLITPIANAIEDKWLLCKRKHVAILIRTIILVSTVLVAIFVPFFAHIMAFIGASFGVTKSLSFPCTCYLKMNKAARKFGFELMVIIVILIIGTLIGILGNYVSVRHIVNSSIAMRVCS